MRLLEDLEEILDIPQAPLDAVLTCGVSIDPTHLRQVASAIYSFFNSVIRSS